MYKVLFFLHKNDDGEILRHFTNITVKYLQEIMGKDIPVAKVESNLLLDQKYSHYCEITSSNKDEMDKWLHSKSGKKLNKDLMDFHQHITVIMLNYDLSK